MSILEKIATDSIAGSLANSGIGNPKSPIQNPELILRRKLGISTAKKKPSDLLHPVV
jgi:hypothetical protein